MKHLSSSCLPLLLSATVATAPMAASAADDVAPGFRTEEQLAPAPGTALRHLSNGTVVVLHDHSVDLYTESGLYLWNLGTLPAPGEVGALAVDPNEEVLVVGERASGDLYRMELDGSGQTLLASLEGNTAAAFESMNRVLVSAATGTAGPGCELWRLRLHNGSTALILAVPGAPGPVTLDPLGRAWLATRAATSPAPAGSSDVLRVAGADLGAVDTLAWQDEDGLVAIQVESVPPAGDWVVETTHAGFTGESYYRWAGPNLFNSPGSGVLTYPVHVAEDGVYQLRIHNRHNNPDSTLENDCWARMDGGSWTKVYSGGHVASWNWESEFDPGHVDATYFLTAGHHTLQISGRSHGYMIDRLHLFRTDHPNPTDKTTPESYLWAPGLEVAQEVGGPFDGADSLAADAEHGTVFLAETSADTGASRVHALGGPMGHHTLLLNASGEGLVSNLEHVPGDGAGFFYPYQPLGSGRLVYLREDAATGAFERFELTPARPKVHVTGPGTDGSGPVDVTLVGGPDGGFAALFAGPAALAGPAETPFPVGGLPLVHTALDTSSLIVVPGLLPLDADGGLSLSFHNSLGLGGVLGLQFLVFDAGGQLAGTSSPQLL